MIATKACPIVLQDRHGVTEILAFEHPAAGRQIVKGSIEPGESAEQAAVRELREESGIFDAKVTQDLGLWEAPNQNHIWSLYLCEAKMDLPDRWSFETKDDGGHVFRFFWHPLHSEFSEPCNVLFVEALQEIRSRIQNLAPSSRPTDNR